MQLVDGLVVESLSSGAEMVLASVKIEQGTIGMLEELKSEQVVVDLLSPFVCLGTLLRIDDRFLELGDADLHDLRDSDTTRDNYVARSKAAGIMQNRRKVLIVRSEIAAIGRLADVLAG
jgi:hypothetical protein